MDGEDTAKVHDSPNRQDLNPYTDMKLHQELSPSNKLYNSQLKSYQSMSKIKQVQVSQVIPLSKMKSDEKRKVLSDEVGNVVQDNDLNEERQVALN